MLTAARLAYCRDHNGNLRDISGRFAGTRSNVAELTGPGVRAHHTRAARVGKSYACLVFASFARCNAPPPIPAEFMRIVEDDDPYYATCATLRTTDD